MSSLEYAVRPTLMGRPVSWCPPTSGCIPRNTSWRLGWRAAEPTLLNRIAQGIDSIIDHFDVVILDPPPALGTISLSVMRAANALLGADPAHGRGLHLHHQLLRHAA